MKPLDSRLKFEEQIFMKRDVANIKARMLQFVEHARSGRMHQMEAMMVHGQMQQMAQQVLMIRARCQHVFEREYTIQNDTVTTVEEVCVICETRKSVSEFS